MTATNDRQRSSRGRRYQVRLQLNDAGAAFPAGHRIRLAFSTTYWPMIWPAPDKATVTIHAGSLDLPVRPRRAEILPPLPPPQTAPPEKVAHVGPGTVRVDRLGLELGTQAEYAFDLEGDDPLSATARMTRRQTIRRGAWQVSIETRMQWSCTRDAFVLEAELQAWEGGREVARRTWDRRIPRDLV